MVSTCKIFLVLLLVFCNQLFAQTVTREPYLQAPTENSIVIRWRTAESILGKLKFGTGQNSEINQISENEPTTEHIIKITNLKPDTKYYYQIENHAANNGNDARYFFKTAPTKNTKRTMNFWAGGDFGDLSLPEYENNQAAVRDAYLKYKKNTETDMWFWLGDNGYGKNRDVVLQKSIFDFYGKNIMLNTPFSAALGNHEFDEDPVNQQKTRDVHQLKITSPPIDGEAGGFSSKNKAYYSFNYGNIHFICLDTYGMDEGKYRIWDKRSTQYNWLVQDLIKNEMLWTIVFFHHPPYTKRSHDSDIEPELGYIRQALVPLFDQYEVDLVMSGHSHIYERSYLISGHTGDSYTFNKTQHLVKTTKGFYDKIEKPFINKDKGTIYVVAGSFGKLEYIPDEEKNKPAHPTSVYSNLTIGGSVVFSIKNNRLDLKWLCADGQIRDKFTIFKNVNKAEKIDIEYGDSTKLVSSWEGTHQWNNNQIGNEIIVKPLQSTNYFVKDSLDFLQDKFDLRVTERPIIETLIANNQSFISGQKIKTEFTLQNTLLNKWQFEAILSDENGNFANPKFKQNISSQKFDFELPEVLKPSKNYKIKVIANSNAFDVFVSPSFEVKAPNLNFEILNTQKAYCIGQRINLKPKFINVLPGKRLNTILSFIPNSDITKIITIPFNNLDSTISIVLPLELENFNKFKIKISDQNPFTENIESDWIDLYQKATLSFGEVKNIGFNANHSVILKLTGTAPYTYKTNFQDWTTISQATISIPVNTYKVREFKLEGIKNVCGNGQISSQNLYFMADPLGLELKKIGVDLSPNPAKDTIIIKLNHKNNPTKILIKNLAGKNILQKTCKENYNNIDISSFENGLYIVQIINKIGQTTKKIVIQK